MYRRILHAGVHASLQKNQERKRSSEETQRFSMRWDARDRMDAGKSRKKGKERARKKKEEEKEEVRRNHADSPSQVVIVFAGGTRIDPRRQAGRYDNGKPEDGYPSRQRRQ